MKKLILVLVYSMLVFQLVSADVISINAGGSDNLIINPNRYIESFFFGNPLVSVLEDAFPGTGSTPEVGEEMFIELEVDAWYFNREEILKIKFRNESDYLDVDAITYNYIDLNNIRLEELSLMKISDGSYEQYYIAKNDVLEAYTIVIEILILKNRLVYSESIDILIIQPTLFQRIMFGLFGTRNIGITSSIIFVILLGFLIIIILIIILIVLCRRDKKDDRQ